MAAHTKQKKKSVSELLAKFNASQRKAAAKAIAKVRKSKRVKRKK